MGLSEKITIKNIDKMKKNFESNLKEYQNSLKKDMDKVFFKIVKQELLKEDLELFNSLKKCEECQFFISCNEDKGKQHCIKLETIYCDYRISDEYNDVEDILWKPRDSKNNKNYFELENNHLTNLIHFFYKNELATLEQLSKNENYKLTNIPYMFKNIKNEKNKIRERVKIRVIRKIIELKEKYNMQNKINEEQQQEFLYNFFLANKEE